MVQRKGVIPVIQKGESRKSRSGRKRKRKRLPCGPSLGDLLQVLQKLGAPSLSSPLGAENEPEVVTLSL